jgi:hypothetical protein
MKDIIRLAFETAKGFVASVVLNALDDASEVGRYIGNEPHAGRGKR